MKFTDIHFLKLKIVRVFSLLFYNDKTPRYLLGTHLCLYYKLDGKDQLRFTSAFFLSTPITSSYISPNTI